MWDRNGGCIVFVRHKINQWHNLLVVITLLFVSQIQGAGAVTIPAGAVYTMDNSAFGNRIYIYHRFNNGRVAFAGAISTGGLGTGESLGNQGAIQIGPAESYLYAVNAGSNNISTFQITEEGLVLLQTVPSQGERPLSLTVGRERLYVLNAGGSAGTSDSIAGFHIDLEGLLTPISGSVAALSADVTRPAQVGLSPDGAALVVTERETHKITIFDIDSLGVPSKRRVYDSEGLTPFGFEFGVRGALVVAEGVLGDTEASSVSSYGLDYEARLNVITSSARTFQTAACWLVLSPDKKMAFTTNPASDSISRFSINFDGELSLERHWSRLLKKGDRPLDITITKDTKTLYVLLSGSDQLAVIPTQRFRRRARVVQRVNTPSGANGLAVR